MRLERGQIIHHARPRLGVKAVVAEQGNLESCANWKPRERRAASREDLAIILVGLERHTSR